MEKGGGEEPRKKGEPVEMRRYDGNGGKTEEKKFQSKGTIP